MAIGAPGELDGAVARAVRAGPPGACLAVATSRGMRVGCAGFRQVFGDYAPLPEPLPMTAGTWHDLASVTKVACTSLVILSLVDQGALHLASPVCAFVPGFSGGRKGEVTVADLLLHRAGLWEWWPAYIGASGPDAALELVSALPLRYPPGAGRHYSDLGFMLLGRIAETVTGKPLPEAFSALVAAPLGMRDMRFAHPPEGAEVAAGAAGDSVERRMIATGEPYPVAADTGSFSRWRTRVRLGEVDDGNAYHAFGGVAGHAGLFGTVADLCRLGLVLLGSAGSTGGADAAGMTAGDGGPWRPATVRAFLADGPDPGQALGFRSWTTTVGSCAARASGHPGFTGTAFAVLPAHGAAVVLATNRLHVAAAPAAFGPIWRNALDAAHTALHIHAEER